MRLSPQERNYLKDSIAHFKTEIDVTKMKKGSLASTFNSMMVFPSADLDDKHLRKEFADFGADENIDKQKKETKDAALHYIAGIYTMERELSKRTWKDYLKHPFRSIAERIAFSQQKTKAMKKFNFTKEQYNLAMDNIAEIQGDGRPHGTIDPKDTAPELAPEKKTVQKETAEKVKTEREEVLNTEKLESDVSLGKKAEKKSQPVSQKQKTVEIQSPTANQ